MSRAIPHIPIWAIMACSRVNLLPFTLPCHHLKINHAHFISSQTEVHMNDSISYFISSASVFHPYCILTVF